MRFMVSNPSSTAAAADVLDVYADRAPVMGKLSPELRAALDQAVADLAAGRAIVVPMNDAPRFLATLAAITKLHRCEDLSKAELALLYTWEPELTAEDFEADADIPAEAELARLLGPA